jgi:flagellin-specific chaperone FliS
MNRHRILWEIKRAKVIISGIPLIWKYLIVYEMQDFLQNFFDYLIDRLIKINYKTQKGNTSHE